MTTGYLPQDLMITLKLMADKAAMDSAQISDLISTYLSSTFVEEMTDGDSYYKCRHDILDHKRTYFIDSLEQESNQSNEQLPHPFHKILVDQKAAYVAGKPIVVSIAKPDEETPDPKADKFQALLNEQLGVDFDDKVNEWIVGASNKAVEWMHFYVDKDGDLNYIVIPAQQVIPIYDTQYQNELLYVIRFYVYDYITAKGTAQRRYKVEWWSKTGVEYWTQIEDQTFVRDIFYDVNPAPHWTVQYGIGEFGGSENHSWGRVPFIPLYNNAENQTDLAPIKALIDAYDKVKSGWMNDIQDFAEMLLVLKGFQGLSGEAESGYTQLGLFMKNLREDHAVGVAEDGSVTNIQSQIPVEAKEKFLALTRKEIFYFGQGVDITDEKVGGAPSGIALQFLYAALDMKANKFIIKLKSALKDFFWFVTTFINEKTGSDYDPKSIVSVVNKSMIFNQVEIIQSLVLSKDMLSEETILENHPMVNDVQAEMRRLDSQREKQRVEMDAQRKELEAAAMRNRSTNDQLGKPKKPDNNTAE